jgi:dTDP-glucose 4,6-dehydratase
MKTAVVTGGLGFIGSNLIRILSNNGYFVINIDKVSYASSFRNISENIKNYRFYKLNINNQNKVYEVLNKYKPKVIYNLAAETHVDKSIDGPKEFINSNILGVFNLLEAIRNYIKKNSLRFIHISTDEVYGDIIDKIKSKEGDCYKPSSPYAASKASSDHLVNSYIRTYKIPGIITNCCNNYGPNQYPEKLIPRIIYNIINKKEIPIYGNGKNIREWIYVDDHCNGLIKVAEKGIIGENYNIGSGHVFNNVQLTEKIILLYKKFNKNIKYNFKIKFIKDRPGHDLKYSLDSSKIKKELAWICQYSFSEGIKKTVIWYMKNLNNNYFKNKDYKKRIGLKI